MTSPRPHWTVVAHAGTPTDYWHTLIQSGEADALSVYRDNLPRYIDHGGLRLLDEEGHVQRFAGPLGKEKE